MPSNIVYGKNVRMAQCRCCTGFLLETRHASSICRNTRRKDFYRNVTIQSRIARSINLSHPTSADLPKDDVRTKVSPRLECHCKGPEYMPLSLEFHGCSWRILIRSSVIICPE